MIKIAFMTLAIHATALHPTTLACLEALTWLQPHHTPVRILDMGCGNGILSVAAASLWPKAQIIAVDCEENALRDTRLMAAEHGLEARITPLRAQGFSHADIAAHCPYDLIMANLLADTLLALALPLQRHLAPQGYALISGFFGWQAEGVAHAFSGLRFDIAHKISKSPWECHLLAMS